ncbi:hypothetical protein OG285_33345 [Streptomyces sp. NBC_01471]|uniref:hypothetical protein n=1 Tax=Streptomyces sp. NBC_01471 TaxID=2903879 RepID=UPI003255018B
MTTTPRRPARELPGDPSRLFLDYGHAHPIEPNGYEDNLEFLYVNATYGQRGDEGYEDDDALPEDGKTLEAGSPVGHLVLCRLRAYTGESRWEVADAESGDLEVIASAILSPKSGEYAKSLSARPRSKSGTC